MEHAVDAVQETLERWNMEPSIRHTGEQEDEGVSESFMEAAAMVVPCELRERWMHGTDGVFL